MALLTAWLREPEDYRLVLVCSGGRRALAEFAEVWVGWRGVLDLPVAEWKEGPSRSVFAPGESGALWVVRVDSFPQYFVLSWLLERGADWEVFYQERGALVSATDPVTGVFLPWGWAFDFSQQIDNVASIILSSGSLAALPSNWEDLFELLDRQNLIELDTPHKKRAETKSLPAPAGESATLEIRLEKMLPFSGPTNPRSELERVTRLLKEMEERQATLKWMVDNRKPEIEAYVYLEMPQAHYGVGTHWELREWYTMAADSDIQQFRHVRAALEDLGVVHVVIPIDLDRPILAHPPRPTFLLRLDRRWYTRSRVAFVHRGLELRPAPPLRNDHVAELLEGALWAGPGSRSDYLFVLRRDDKHDFRFTIPPQDFAPLTNRIDALNRHVATQWLSRLDPGVNPLDKLLAALRDSLAERMADHGNQMLKLLKEILEGLRADIRDLGGTAAAIHNSVADVRKLRMQAETLSQQQWSVWNDFRRRLLEADVNLLPPSGLRYQNWLRQLDGLRQELFTEAITATRSGRNALAAGFAKLGEELRNAKFD